MNSREMHNLIASFDPQPMVGVTPTMVSMQEMDRVESTLGCSLPQLYRDFVAAYAGSYFRRAAVFGVSTANALYAKFSLAGISGFGAGLPRVLRSLDYVPKDLLPIVATEPTGYVCIGVSPDHFGKVFVCVMDLWDGEDAWSATMPVARSFDAFLAKLRRG
jgi:hypothetical protein